MWRTFKLGSAACFLAILVCLSGLMGCVLFRSPGNRDTIQYATLGSQDPGEAAATVALRIETYGDSDAVTIAEYGVPSPQSVSIRPASTPYGIRRTTVSLTCFVPVDAGGNGTLGIRVSRDDHNHLATVYVAPSGSARVDPDLFKMWQ